MPTARDGSRFQAHLVSQSLSRGGGEEIFPGSDCDRDRRSFCDQSKRITRETRNFSRFRFRKGVRVLPGKSFRVMCLAKCDRIWVLPFVVQYRRSSL